MIQYYNVMNFASTEHYNYILLFLMRPNPYSKTLSAN
jgi:hypothetical protein